MLKLADKAPSKVTIDQFKITTAYHHYRLGVRFFLHTKACRQPLQLILPINR